MQIKGIKIMNQLGQIISRPQLFVKALTEQTHLLDASIPHRAPLALTMLHNARGSSCSMGIKDLTAALVAALPVVTVIGLCSAVHFGAR